MIKQAAYGTEPWRLVEKRLDLDLLAQSESVFALSNGHIGLRGNLDEGDPHGLPGTYLNSMYEVRPLPYAEAGYGFPDSGQTVINVTNGKIIRLMVDDEPFDIRYGTLNSHERILDLQAGTLTRNVDWSSPAGARVKVSSVRMVSLTQRAIAAINYTVEPVDQTLRLVLQSELVANEELPQRGNDPRLAAILESPLVSEEHQTDDGTPPRVVLVHKTRVSGLRMAAGMSHVITGPAKKACRTESHPDLGRSTVATEVAPGEQVNIVKYISYGWSSQRSKPAMIDQIIGALAAAHLTGWEGLLAEQRAYLDEFWAGADVEVDGDAEVQQAVRFGLFHILQAGAGRVPADRGQGPDRQRLRRAHVLGHREFRAAGAHVHPAFRRGRRAALAAPGAAGGQAARGRSRPGRGRVPVADDSGPGVLRLLARRDRRLPHQRRHRRRRSAATWTPPRTPSSSRKSALSCWSRPRGCGGRWASTMHWAGSGSRA